jgi:hypothetical protein
MNKKFLSINLVLFTFLTICKHTYSQTISDSLYSFRGTYFGAKAQQVEANETAKYMQDFNGLNIHALSYKGEFAEIDVRIDYVFREGILVEGSYNIADSDNLIDDFKRFFEALKNDFGSPTFYSNGLIDNDNIWIKASDYGAYKGPELYWQFKNGFIALIASKFKNEETLTTIYTINKNISEYGPDIMELPD